MGPILHTENAYNRKIKMKGIAHKFVQREYLSIEHERKIFDWANAIGMSLRVSDEVVRPRTYEPSSNWSSTWYFETAEDKTIFLLKWR